MASDATGRWTIQTTQQKKKKTKQNKTKQNKEIIDLDVKEDRTILDWKINSERQATNADPIMSELKVWILQGWPEYLRKLHKDLQPYNSYPDKLSIENGILLKETRYWSPN